MVEVVSRRQGGWGAPRDWRFWLIVGLSLSFAMAGIWIAAFAGVLKDLAGPALDGCGPEPADPRYCLTATLEGRRLVVVGHTTLPDGAIIEVWVENMDHLDDPDQNTAPMLVTTKGGRFTATFDVSSWDPGELTVAALLRIDSQPRHIQALYGSDGSGFYGPATRYDYDYDPPPKDLEAWVDLRLGP